MQFFTGISRNTQSKLYTLSLTECVRDFQNNALWDTDEHGVRLAKISGQLWMDTRTSKNYAVDCLHSAL